MAKYLPAGFKVLTDELHSSAKTMDTISTHLGDALTTLNSFVARFEATEAMEDGLYGSSHPGQALLDYWTVVHPRATTLVSDVQAIGKALDTAATAYVRAEDASTHKPSHHTGPTATHTPSHNTSPTPTHQPANGTPPGSKPHTTNIQSGPVRRS